jgi:hypothetical protein
MVGRVAVKKRLAMDRFLRGNSAPHHVEQAASRVPESLAGANCTRQE